MIYWNKRTNIEKFLISTISILIILDIVLIAKPFVFPQGKTVTKICMTESCIRNSANILKNMDPTVNPCDDFYEFACGNFIKTAYIPDKDTSSISPWSKNEENFYIQWRKLIEDPIRKHDLHYIVLMKTLYNACMNDTKHQEENLRYVMKLVKDLGGWPILEDNNWSMNNFDWQKLLYNFRKLNLRPCIFIKLDILDDKNSSKKIVTVRVDDLGFNNNNSLKAYQNLILDTAILLGAEPAGAAAEITELMRFVEQINKIATPTIKNFTISTNMMSINELQENYSSIDWLKFINSFLTPAGPLLYSDKVKVFCPKCIEKLENILSSTSKRILANYMMWFNFYDHFEYFPSKFQMLQEKFKAIVYGREEQFPRWKKCLLDSAISPLCLSSIYVKRFYKKVQKNAVVNLVNDIKTSLLETLKKAEWMDRKTKAHALQKANLMQTLVAYPEELLEDHKINELYKDIILDPKKSFLELNRDLKTYEKNRKLKFIFNESIIKEDWKEKTFSYKMNTFYEISKNRLDLQAAILQEPFFHEDRPQYLNYGALGYIIGHEITHGFIGNGRQYDKNGNLRDWWHIESDNIFSNKAKCLVQQYGNFSIPNLKISIDGEQSLEENIADNGGLKIAYHAYEKWLEKNGYEDMLPGLNYNFRQMFWISAANIYCKKYQKESLKDFVEAGHTPSYFRITVPFMNSGFFAKDFKCPLGTAMNPKYKCRVW